MPETIDRTLDALAERYDMALPLGDLFYSSAEKALLSDTATGGYAGTENVGDTPCSPPGVPRRGRGLGALAAGAGRAAAEAAESGAERPHGPAGGRRDVHGLELRAADHRRHLYRRSVPADYEGIAMLQRAAAVKGAAAKPSTEPGAPAKK